jgi:hypothetical protein
MLTWQQFEVIIQALDAGVVTLARRPLIGTEVEHPSCYNYQTLGEPFLAYFRV